MFGFIKNLFGKKAEETKVEECPYKVETQSPVAEQATQAVVESIVVEAPVAEKAPAKKPRKPRAPKTAAPAKKAPAKKTKK
jgi:hypothetical protein